MNPFDGAAGVRAVLVIADLLHVTKPGAWSAFTTWEPSTGPGYSAAMTEAGFVDVEVEKHPDWERRRRAVYEAALALDAADDPALESLHREARRALPELASLRRVLIAARRPA